jgi:hypothetical protein
MPTLHLQGPESPAQIPNRQKMLFSSYALFPILATGGHQLLIYQFVQENFLTHVDSRLTFYWILRDSHTTLTHSLLTTWLTPYHICQSFTLVLCSTLFQCCTSGLQFVISIHVVLCPWIWFQSQLVSWSHKDSEGGHLLSKLGEGNLGFGDKIQYLHLSPAESFVFKTSSNMTHSKWILEGTGTTPPPLLALWDADLLP